MKRIGLQIVVVAMATAAPALAEQTMPHFTRASTIGDQRVVAMKRRIGALRDQIGQIELQRLIDRVSAESAPAPAVQIARIGPR